MSTELNLNPEAIRRANSNSFFNPGDSYAAEARGVYKKLLPLFEDKPGYTDEQREYLIRRGNEWKTLVENAYNDMIHRRGQFVPVTVAGPARYPVEKMAKIAERNMRTSAEWGDKMERFEENTRKQLARMTPLEQVLEKYRKGYNEPITSDDPAAVEKLTARLAYLKEMQENMKVVNAWYRKNGTCVDCPVIDEEAARKLDVDVARGASWEKKPFPSYALSNNNGNINRLQQRLRQVERSREAAQEARELGTTKQAVEHDGFRVVQNVELQRLQILFNEKPDEDTRTLLKQNGFRWSPREKAWQRLLNGNSLYALERLSKSLGNK